MARTRHFPTLVFTLVGSLAAGCAPAGKDSQNGTGTAGKADGPGGFTCERPGDQTPLDGFVPDGESGLSGRAELLSTEQGLLVVHHAMSEELRGPKVGWQLFDAATLKPKGKHRTLVNGKDYFGDAPELVDAGDKVTVMFTQRRAGFEDETTCMVKAVSKERLWATDPDEQLAGAGPRAIKRGSCGPGQMVWGKDQLGVLHSRTEGDGDPNLIFNFARADEVAPSMEGSGRALGPYDTIGGADLAHNAETEQYVAVYGEPTEEGNTELFTASMSVEGARIGHQTRLTQLDGKSWWPELLRTDDGYAVVWFEEMTDEDQAGLYMQMLDGDGRAAEGSEPHFVGKALPGAADLAWDAEAGTLGVAWIDGRGNVKLSRFDKSGAAQGDPVPLGGVEQMRADVSIAHTGRTFTLAWSGSPRKKLSGAMYCTRGAGSGSEDDGDSGPSASTGDDSGDSSTDDSSSEDGSSEDSGDDSSTDTGSDSSGSDTSGDGSTSTDDSDSTDDSGGSDSTPDCGGEGESCCEPPADECDSPRMSCSAVSDTCYFPGP